MKKDVIYVDIDDEITIIIDKVVKSPQKIVALVLPKRATVLQSIVNMRLLKRSAENAKKRVVLITTETVVTSLAGVASMYVAKNLQSKPAIPEAPEPDQPSPPELPESDSAESQPLLDAKKSIGELAGLPEEESVEIEMPSEKADVPEKEVKSKPDKKLKVPNFNRFRLKLMLAFFLIVGLGVGYYFATAVMPTAEVSIEADVKTMQVIKDVTISTTTKEPDYEKGIVPAISTETKKSVSEKVTATGEVDKGTKAFGTVTITNCTNDPVTVPAGSGISSGEFTFITSASVTVPASDGVVGTGACKNNGKEIVAVVAMNAGDKYNLSARNYAVAGQSANVTAYGEAMTGGTTKLVKVFSQADFDKAKESLLSKRSDDIETELKKKLEEQGLRVLDGTFAAKDTAVSASPKVGEEVTESTVTADFNYSLMGIKSETIKAIIEQAIKDKVDLSKQKLYKNGVAEALLKSREKDKNGNIPTKLTTNVTYGPILDETEIKNVVMGKKRGEALNILQERPGVKQVTINLKPFWVSKAPKKAEKITVRFNVPTEAQATAN